MKLVLAHGVFDLLHWGHIEYLRKAREYGDSLLVSVVPDRLVMKPHLIHSEDIRVSMLRAIRYVDAVHLCKGAGPEDLIEEWLPDVYVRPDQYEAQDRPEYALVKKLGIQVAFTKPLPIHTSDLIARIKAL